mgnify:CR=1 FL=1|jgi:hypothetical protein
MHLLAILLIVLTRLVVVLPLLLLWWLALLAKGLVLAIGDTGLFLLRLFVGGVLRPLGHRYALLAVTAAVVVAGATMPELQNPSFYVVLVIALVACFLAGKFGRVLLPKAGPDYSRTFPPLPGWPSWPPYPKAQPRKPKAGPTREPSKPRKEHPVDAPGALPVRPVPTPVAVMAAASPMRSPSEEEAARALPEALQRLMQPKIPPTGGPTAQEQTG